MELVQVESGVENAWYKRLKQMRQRMRLMYDNSAFNVCFQFELDLLCHGQSGHGAARSCTPLGRAVQVDSIKIRVETVYGFSA